MCFVGIFFFHIRDIRVIRGRMRCFLLFLGLSAQVLGAGLGPYPKLVVADSAGTSRNGVRVTYLGTNGYQFEFKGHALLVDPYFSRVDLFSVALGARIQPNISRITDAMRHLASRAPKVDAILVTHGHFDHLLDVPVVMATTKARLIASASSVELAKRAGALSGQAVKPGDVRRIGSWKIRVLPATHDRLFGKVPFDRPPSRVPQRAADWICGEPLAFLIEVNGQRIYIDSGGTLAQLPPDQKVDLAILGMALPDSRERLSAALERLQPHARKSQIPSAKSQVRVKPQVPKMKDDAKPRDLEDRTFRFAELVRGFVKQLPRTISNTEDVRQLVRSSGSVAANWIEADEALSRKDFLMRVKICRKEAKESRLFLRLVDAGLTKNFLFDYFEERIIVFLDL